MKQKETNEENLMSTIDELLLSQDLLWEDKKASNGPSKQSFGFQFDAEYSQKLEYSALLSYSKASRQEATTQVPLSSARSLLKFI